MPSTASLARHGQQHGANHQQRAVRTGHRELQALAMRGFAVDREVQFRVEADRSGGDVLVALVEPGGDIGCE
ncbi:hypothetical protein [Candidatus Skiveiella danica]|uniref:hypothetical protein n=1 Tax=Candidatus Skiveiella danica TaxID=3386177 RepID=UPI0039B8F0F4